MSNGWDASREDQGTAYTAGSISILVTLPLCLQTVTQEQVWAILEGNESLLKCINHLLNTSTQHLLCCTAQCLIYSQQPDQTGNTLCPLTDRELRLPSRLRSYRKPLSQFSIETEFELRSNYLQSLYYYPIWAWLHDHGNKTFLFLISEKTPLGSAVPSFSGLSCSHKPEPLLHLHS
jgi:hypothetical protein